MFEMLVNFRVLHWLLAPWSWLYVLWIISMILFAGVPDWKDSLPVCHALPQSVSFQVQLVQKMSSQGKYPYMITLLECKLNNLYQLNFTCILCTNTCVYFRVINQMWKKKNRLNKTSNEIKSDILISINR